MRSLKMVAGLVVMLTLAGIAYDANAVPACVKNDTGCEIYNGQHALNAQLRDDARMLPGSATRCVNCHTQTGAGAGYAPPLTAANLFPAKPRRGGPASSYDQASFCQTVRSGVDPSNVMLKKAMPHFQLSDTECASLWHYVSTR